MTISLTALAEQTIGIMFDTNLEILGEEIPKDENFSNAEFILEFQITDKSFKDRFGVDLKSGVWYKSKTSGVNNTKYIYLVSFSKNESSDDMQCPIYTMKLMVA